MPYLVRSGSPAPWFAATNDALDQMVGVAAQDRARRMNEGVQIRGEQRGEQRQVAGEQRGNTEWERRFGIGQNAQIQGEQRAEGRQIAGEQRGEQRQIAGEQRGYSRQDMLRQEGYARDAAGGNSLMDFAMLAGLIPKTPGMGQTLERNAAPGPLQGAMPVPQMFNAMRGEVLRQQELQAQQGEARNIIGASQGAGLLPEMQMPDGAYGPAPLPQFQTPQAAGAFVNNVQQQGQFRATMDEQTRHRQAMEQAAVMRNETTFNQNGGRTQHARFVADDNQLAKIDAALQSDRALEAADGWITGNYATPQEAIRDGVMTPEGEPIIVKIRQKIAAQRRQLLQQSVMPQGTRGAVLGTLPGQTASDDPEADAMLDAMLRGGF